MAALKNIQIRDKEVPQATTLSTFWHLGQPDEPQNDGTINPDVFTEENLFFLPSLVERYVV